jgi:hypothetical protein
MVGILALRQDFLYALWFSPAKYNFANVPSSSTIQSDTKAHLKTQYLTPFLKQKKEYWMHSNTQ